MGKWIPPRPCIFSTFTPSNVPDNYGHVFNSRYYIIAGTGTSLKLNAVFGIFLMVYGFESNLVILT